MIYTTDQLRGHATRPSPVETWWIATSMTLSIQFSRLAVTSTASSAISCLFGRRPRVKSVGQVIAELDLLYESGWRSNVFFVDDNLIGNRRYLKESCFPASSPGARTRADAVQRPEGSINLADDPN